MRGVTAVLLRGRGTAGGLWRPGGPGGGAAAGRSVSSGAD